MDVKKQHILRLFQEFNRSSFAKAGGQVCGCNYRAHYIAEKLKEKQSYPVKKIWVWGGDLDTVAEDMDSASSFFFAPASDFEKKEYEGYNFHVAAAIELDDGELIVFDPSLYDGPVTAEQWKGDMVEHKNYPLNFRVTSPDVYAFGHEFWEPEPEPLRRSLRTEFRNAASTRFNLFMMTITKRETDMKWPRVKSEWAAKP